MAMLRALAAAMAVAAFFEVALCVNYDVGGPAGAWDLSTNYTQWVSGKTFRLGDTLSEFLNLQLVLVSNLAS